MKNIETVTIDGAIHSKPWKTHELNEVVRVEMDYHSLIWCCYLIQLINKTVADQIEHDLIYGTDEKSIDGLTIKEALLVLRLDQIKRTILNEERDKNYLVAIDKAIWALKMVGEKDTTN